MALWLEHPGFRNIIIRVTRWPAAIAALALGAVFIDHSLGGLARALLFPLAITATVLHPMSWSSDMLESMPLK
jgi:hypothetical protein